MRIGTSPNYLPDKRNAKTRRADGALVWLMTFGLIVELWMALSVDGFSPAGVRGVLCAPASDALPAMPQDEEQCLPSAIAPKPIHGTAAGFAPVGMMLRKQARRAVDH